VYERSIPDWFEMEKLAEVLQKQMERQKQRYKEQLQLQREQVKRQKHQLELQEANHKAQLEAILQTVGKSQTVASSSLQGATPSFEPFNLSSELWTDYWARFCAFARTHSVANAR